MITDLKPYREYKESGLRWLGKVPGHWSVRRIKTVLQETDCRAADGSGMLLSLTRARGLIPHKDMTDKMHSAKTLVGYKRYCPGQLVMNRMQAWSGMFGAGTTDGLVSPDYAVFDVLGGHAIKLVLERLKTPDLVGQFALESKGIGSGFNRLYTDRFGPIPISLPPPDEQAAIVRFLDHVNRRIDRFIRAKRKLITLLGEQKQAIIHRAVTRGLDPNVPMKDSGVPWLGEIPAHWEVRRLKWVTRLQRGYDLPANMRTRGRFPVVSSGGMIDTHSESRCAGPGVVMGRYGSTDAVFFIEPDFWPHNTALFVTDFQGNLPKWCYFMLRTISKADHASKSAVPGIDRKDLYEVYVPRPPRSEQLKIVDSLNTALSGVESGHTTVDRQIALIREYRTRLVADVVTGQLDVRDAARALPAEGDDVPREVDDADEVAAEEDALDPSAEETEA